MQQTMTKRILTLVSAALIGGLLSWAAVAQMAQSSVSIVGSSPTSWEEAAKNAVEEAGKHLRDIRVAEVEALDLRLEEGKVVEYRAQMKIKINDNSAAAAATRQR